MSMSGREGNESRKPIRISGKSGDSIDADRILKGQLLAVKTPPYYRREYIYQVTSYGDKLVRATLHHSPRVRKQWSREEFDLLMEMGLVRFAGECDAGGD